VKDFQDLSRRSRLRRVNRLAHSALEAYGMKDAQLRFLQYTANFIYRIDLSNQPQVRNSPYISNRFVLRIHTMDNIEAVSAEMTWLTALSQEAGLPVPAPISTPAGALLEKIFTPEIPDGRIVTVMRWLDGRRLEKGMRPDHLHSLGQVVARMHAFSAAWQPPAGFARAHWDWDSQLGGSMFEQPLAELVESMPLIFQEPFAILSREAKMAMSRLGKRPDAFGMIHGDLYPENVLFKAGQAFPIDFEDCGYGYWMWDIAVALCSWAWNADWERMRDAFCEGYTQIHVLPEEQWQLLDLFVATQFATMLLWASAFLKDDPMRAAEHEPWRDDSGKKLLRYFERSGISGSLG
jgi:Ser/Thr protein kinase RdoA (MazF antagonist)